MPFRQHVSSCFTLVFSLSPFGCEELCPAHPHSVPSPRWQMTAGSDQSSADNTQRRPYRSRSPAHSMSSTVLPCGEPVLPLAMAGQAFDSPHGRLATARGDVLFCRLAMARPLIRRTVRLSLTPWRACWTLWGSSGARLSRPSPRKLRSGRSCLAAWLPWTRPGRQVGGNAPSSQRHRWLAECSQLPSRDGRPRKYGRDLCA